MNSPKHPFKLLAEVWPSRDHEACDGPSYLWRAVLQVHHKVQRVKFSNEICDGHSYLRRSVLQFRREVQRVDPSTQISELMFFGTDTLDGPSCLWRFVLPVIEVNEESSRRNYTSMGRRSPSRSVVTMTVRRVIRRPSQFLSKIIYCSKWLNRSLQ